MNVYMCTLSMIRQTVDHLSNGEAFAEKEEWGGMVAMCDPDGGERTIGREERGWSWLRVEEE